MKKNIFKTLFCVCALLLTIGLAVFLPNTQKQTASADVIKYYTYDTYGAGSYMAFTLTMNFELSSSEAKKVYDYNNNLTGSDLESLICLEKISTYYLGLSKDLTNYYDLELSYFIVDNFSLARIKQVVNSTYECSFDLTAFVYITKYNDSISFNDKFNIDFYLLGIESINAFSPYLYLSSNQLEPTEIFHTVNFYDYEGGNLIASNQLSYYQQITYPTTPTRTGYTFTGWSSNQDVCKGADINIYGTWTTASYNVNFYDYDGGTLLSQQVIEYGNSAIAPDIPTRDGFSFIGWSSNFDYITNNLTIYALWEQTSFSVFYYDFEGGTLLSETYVNYGESVSAPSTIPLRYGYTFTGWSAETNNITENTIVYGTWQINTYTVNFYDYSGGNKISTQTIEYCGSAIAPTDLTRIGYTFSNWDTDDYLYVTEDILVYGIWTINVYTVNFYDYENGNLLTSDTYYYGATLIFPENPTRAGYTFLGWNDNSLYCNATTTIYGTWEIIPGYFDGYDDGYNNGYLDGYHDCEYALSPVDNNTFKGYIYAIFDAPFNVIRNVLNFEFLGINLSSFIITIFSFILLLFVLKMFL